MVAFIPAISRPVRLAHTDALATSGLRQTTFTAAKPIHHSARLPQTVVTPTASIAPEVARTAIAVYGVAISAGGIGAFLRSGSKPSIISGVVAGIVLGGAYVKDSVPLALGTAIALSAVFAIRFVKTKKFVPAGALCILSVVAAIFFAAVIYA